MSKARRQREWRQRRRAGLAVLRLTVNEVQAVEYLVALSSRFLLWLDQVPYR